MDVQLRTVLLVDDDPDMRLYLRSCLRSLTSSFERVLEAGDGLDALRLVRSGEVQLVISDVGLPGLDGRRLSRAIRDDVALEHVSVLLISGDVHLIADDNAQEMLIAAAPTQKTKCVRCWQHRGDVGTVTAHPQLCGRCVSNVEGPGESRMYF